MLAVGSEGLGRDGLCVIKGRREAQRLKQKKRDRKKQADGPCYKADGATLDDLRAAVTTLEDTERIARRVLGGTHPVAGGLEYELQDARAALRARHNAELRAKFKEDPSLLSADDRARAEQLLARDARKAAKKAARRVSSESPGTA